MALSTAKEISPIDALWALFKSQPKAIRKAFTERVLMDDINTEEARRRLKVKQSIDTALQELRESEASQVKLPDARELFR